MKQTLKKFIGPENTLKISKFRTVVKVSVNRFIRSLLNASETFPSLPVRTFALLDAHLFFGYYDVPQFSGDEHLLLATAAPLINKSPGAKDLLRVGYFDLREQNSAFRELSLTSTWCWQQGCRLQWYPAGHQETIIYNTTVNGSYGCVLQNVVSGEIIKSFQRPVYVVSRDGKWGLSLNFSRLQRLRPGYGYNNLKDDTAGEIAPSDDGIWRIDMVSGEEKMLFSISDVTKMVTKHNVTGEHYFNHILFNNACDLFMFFHITQMADHRRNINLLITDINGNEIRVLNDSGYSSHYCWQDENHLLCYSTVIGKGEGYFLFDVNSGESQQVGTGMLNQDGHPTYILGKKLIADTYPDKYGELSLLIYDLKNNNLVTIHKQYMPPKFNDETRCDLHPRVSSSGKYVCIDCIVQNKRAMKVLNISSLLR